MILLVHHGDAVESADDPQRPLSARGRHAVRRLAEQLAARGVRPAFIWHSGKLRARQTAEALRALNPLSDLTAVHGLRPADAPLWIVDRLTGIATDGIVVGHLPNLERILAALVADDAATLPRHGAVALEAGDAAWVESWRLTEPPAPIAGDA